MTLELASPFQTDEQNAIFAALLGKIGAGPAALYADAWWPDAHQSSVGEVSLFNEITYVVQFADRAPGIWWKLDSGHHFDIATRADNQDGILEPNRIAPIGYLQLRRIAQGVTYGRPKSVAMA